MRGFSTFVIFASFLCVSVAGVGCTTRRGRPGPEGVDAGRTTDADMPGCPAGQTRCGDACVDTRTNGDHCGGCFSSCSGAACVDGVCSGDPPICSPPMAMCDEACVDLTTSTSHCGRCFNDCGVAPCVGGVCETACVPDCVGRMCGTDGCGGTCGSCAVGAVCEAGECVTTPVGMGDTCATAIALPATGGVQTFTFFGYTPSHTPFTCGSGSATADVAFRWAPAVSGTATIRLAGPTTDVDTTLAVFGSSACVSELGCNDDTDGYSSELVLSVTVGTTYYIVATYYDAAAPPSDIITLTVSLP